MGFGAGGVEARRRRVVDGGLLGPARGLLLACPLQVNLGSFGGQAQEGQDVLERRPRGGEERGLAETRRQRHPAVGIVGAGVAATGVVAGVATGSGTASVNTGAATGITVGGAAGLGAASAAFATTGSVRIGSAGGIIHASASGKPL